MYVAMLWQLKAGMSARAQASLCPDRRTVFTVSQTEIVIKSSMKPTKTELHVVSRSNSYLHVVSRGNSYLHVVQAGNPGQCSALSSSAWKLEPGLLQYFR